MNEMKANGALEPPLAIKRHYVSLSPAEVDEVVNAAADLIVGFLKGWKDERSTPGGGNANSEKNESGIVGAGR